MKKILLPLLGFALGLAVTVQAEPLRVIFDTDVGNDVDDALAMAMLHSLESRGECKLLAVTITKDSPFAVAFTDLINTFYGRGEIPIGRVKNGKTPEPGKFLQVVTEARDEHGALLYPRRLAADAVVPEAVALLRKTLAAQPDGSVVLIQVGFFSNFARLLESPPDEFSPLAGRELITRKVKLLSAMAGRFNDKKGREYNVFIDTPASQKLCNDWPTPVYFSPWELGDSMKFPAISIERDFNWVAHHPVTDAYRAYMKFPYDRQTWDLTSVLFAVRQDRGYFTVSEPCRVTVNEKGQTLLNVDPQGKHYVLSVTPEQRARALEALILLSSQPTDKLSKGESKP
ncbi:MAG: nucleoside hydrolase [Kiritimatiellaeota bacterium]|nr:nucleoside hydrolase [Kiritimatiellota bacterium]